MSFSQARLRVPQGKGILSFFLSPAANTNPNPEQALGTLFAWNQICIWIHLRFACFAEPRVPQLFDFISSVMPWKTLCYPLQTAFFQKKTNREDSPWLCYCKCSQGTMSDCPKSTASRESLITTELPDQPRSIQLPCILGETCPYPLLHGSLQRSSPTPLWCWLIYSKTLFVTGILFLSVPLTFCFLPISPQNLMLKDN